MSELMVGGELVLNLGSVHRAQTVNQSTRCCVLMMTSGVPP